MPFKWVLCVCENMARDDDIFASLNELSAVEEDPPRVFTCCVGKTLSAAAFHLPDSDEVAGLLDLLAHASLDPSSPAQPFPEAVPIEQLPSTLERLSQLLRLLAGKQLVFLLDYDGCNAALDAPNSAIRRLASLYPTAVVQRNKVAAEDSESLEIRMSAMDHPHLGAISGVQIVSYGAVTGRAVRGASSSAASGEGGTGMSKIVVHSGADSYRPALETFLAMLQQKFAVMESVSVEDNQFSLSVTHKGASEEMASQAREVVSDTLAEFPMLRSLDGRLGIEIRPEVGWNRMRMVEWITSTVRDDVMQHLGIRSALPIYIGEDSAFRHLSQIDGVDILVTGGPGADSFFLRSISQVDQLMTWFVQQHAAGVTVRGGKLPPPRQQSAQQKQQQTMRATAEKHVQIMGERGDRGVGDMPRAVGGYDMPRLSLPKAHVSAAPASAQVRSSPSFSDLQGPGPYRGAPPAAAPP